MTPSRREMFERVGVAVTLSTLGTAIAGAKAEGARTVEKEVLGSDGRDDDPVDTDDELPEYAEWLTIDEAGLAFEYANWATLEEYVAEDIEDEDPDEIGVPTEFEDDAMVAPVTDGFVSTYFFVGLSLAPYRLGRLVEAEAFETTVEGLLKTNESFVITGEIDRAEIDDRVTAEAEFDFISQLEPTDSIGEFDVYTPVENGDDAVVAVGDEALVIGLTDDDADTANAYPSEAVETTIGARTGEVERASEAAETVAWLLAAAGDGDVAVGQYGDRVDVDPAFAALENAAGIATSYTVEDDETLLGEFAAVIDDPDEEAIEDIVGVTADERTIEFENDRVTAEAVWREEVTVDRVW